MRWIISFLHKLRFVLTDQFFVGLFLFGSIILVPTFMLEINHPGHVILIDYTDIINEYYVYLDANAKEYNDYIKALGGKIPKGYYDNFLIEYEEKKRKYDYYIQLEISQNQRKEHYMYTQVDTLGIAAFATISFSLLGFVVSKQQ